MTFASLFDAASFHEGPAAVFTPDPRGNLRIDPERTRELWLLNPNAQGREAAVYVLTDQATGVKMVLATNFPKLLDSLPRADVRRVSDYASARAEAMQQWAEAATKGAPRGAAHEA
ncbi:hypothetical protein LBMAG42_39510 [Deltaproteobacteria bacterium]|nr:hypothetical protein LBMAG42_39510 [Deltaproteobacteria bacterium]